MRRLGVALALAGLLWLALFRLVPTAGWIALTVLLLFIAFVLIEICVR